MSDIALAIIFTTLIILLLIAGVVITIFIANKQRVQREVEYEKELRTVENEVQEQVLTNVARELHDNIGQLLTFIHLQLEGYKLDVPEAKDKLAPIDTSLSTTINQVRLLGRSLSNDMLEQNGLLVSIGQEVERLKQLNGISFHWQHDDKEPELSKDQRVMAFRMFQEVVNNALKHAQAKKIMIELQGDEKFKLRISDDGRGFDIEQMKEGTAGMGLKNIIKRSSLANFECKILASEGKGCIFILESF